MKTINGRSGFTLIELLIVCLVIALLVGLALPAINQVREAARRTDCANKQRQIGIALNTYHETHRHLPPGWIAKDEHGEPGWGWAAVLLPYLDHGNLYVRFDLDTPIDDASVGYLRERVVPGYLCPSDSSPRVMDLAFHGDGHDHGEEHDHDDDDHDHDGHVHDDRIMVARGNYSGVFGTTEVAEDNRMGDGTFYENSHLRLSDFSDGASNTFVVGERRADFGTVTWVGVSPAVAHPFSRIVGSADHPPNAGWQFDFEHQTWEGGHFEDFSSSHIGGANFLWADGSVRFIPNQIDESVYRHLATPRGYEIFNWDF